MGRHMNRHILTVVVTAIGLGLAQIALAADWPTKPVRIISPTSPGGASDSLARMLAEGFADMFGQRFYVENRVGAGGLIGVAAAANAEPDGSTFVISGVAYTVIAPAASRNPGFDPMRDLTHIAYLGGPPIVFVVNPSIGVRSLADLAEYARRTGTLNYGSPGVGTLGHFIAERFSREARVPMQHIPNRGGSTAMMDLVAGTVGLVSTAWSSALGQIRAHRARFGGFFESDLPVGLLQRRDDLLHEGTVDVGKHVVTKQRAVADRAVGRFFRRRQQRGEILAVQVPGDRRLLLRSGVGQAHQGRRDVEM